MEIEYKKIDVQKTSNFFFVLEGIYRMYADF